MFPSYYHCFQVINHVSNLITFPSYVSKLTITFFQEAVELAVSSDKSNPEAFHIAASYLISSSKFDEAKVELKRGLDLWIADHESAEVENEESLLEELQKEKLDPEIRMSALRLTVELEMWDESITIGRWR